MEPEIVVKGYMPIKTLNMRIATLILLMTVSTALIAQKSEIFATKGVAIRGYDAVAYFVDNKPIKGSKAYQYKWNNVSWWFSSAENLAKFKQSPERYAPQYGGYCAYAVANGSTAPTDPEAWAIVDDKLYLNFNTSVQKKWSKNQAEYIKKADQNWPGVLK